MFNLKDVKFKQNLPGNYHGSFKFPNGLELSLAYQKGRGVGMIICGDGAETWEVAVFRGNKFVTTEFTGGNEDSLGWRTEEEIARLAEKVEYADG